jgi:hypothetical protein
VQADVRGHSQRQKFDRAVAQDDSQRRKLGRAVAFVRAAERMAISYWFLSSYIRCDLHYSGPNHFNETHGFFLNFTTRYHQIRVDAHALDKKMKHPPATPNPETVDESDVHEIYFRLFGLIYDEIHAYP